MQTASTVAMQKFKNIYGDDFNFYELDESIQLEAIKQELIFSESFTFRGKISWFYK